MKTLVFVGTPKRKGDSMALVNETLKYLDGEVEVINVFDHLDIKPCMACGYCDKKPGCSIKDGFQDILEKIYNADAYIIASPMWFGNITGPMLSFFSRLQTISSGIIYRKDTKQTWDKAGIFLMPTGSRWHSMGKAVETTVEFVFDHLNAFCLDFVYANNTNILPAKDNQQAIYKCKIASERLNQWYKDKKEGRYYKYGYTSYNHIKPDVK
ncbi:flavodoxin family protein [Clostridium oceanicum]|uniref:NADPH-dependent FMN reductase-like domain-containing protein n=1 Tax=Clostridium oceanicum TaxID=1543 RepID=A0ABN1J851_9CLOT